MIGTKEAIAGSSIPKDECTNGRKRARGMAGLRSHIDRRHKATACVTSVKDVTENLLVHSNTLPIRIFASRTSSRDHM